MEIPVIEKIKRLPEQTEESLRDAFSVLMSVEDRKAVDHYIRWIRAEARKIRSADMYELIKQTYFFAGQYSFDDFMIAMEWNREPQARFWLPCRKVLEGKHGIVTQIQHFIDDPDVRDPLKFLRQREVTHYQRFADALGIAQSMTDSRNFYAFNPSFDKGPGNCDA